MIVVDASVIVDAFADYGTRGRDARRMIAGQDLTAPSTLVVEVANVIRRRVAAGKVPTAIGNQAIDAFGRMACDYVSPLPLLARMWELRHNVTGYDASYVALAEREGIALYTTDAKLALASGVRCPVVVVGP